MNTTQLRILHLEDNPLDAELIATALADSGISTDIVRVAAEREFVDALERREFDLIISDFSVPSWDGRAALKLAKDRFPGTPFIFVSGTIGEGAAVESLRNGATDYVLKHEFLKLVPAVRRAQREAYERRMRKKAELKLEETSRQLQDLFNNLDDVFFSINPAGGGLLQLSPACEKLSGWPASAFFTNSELWKQCIHPEDRDLVLLKQSALSIGQPVQIELRVLTREGGIRWVDARLKPAFGVDGNLAHVDGILRDITERKQTEAEKRRIEAQLLRNQRMESIGTLAGGVAHDLNNVLSPILMVAELLRDKITDESSISLLDTLEVSAKRGAGIVRQVLTFARGTEGERVTLQSKHLLDNMHKMLRQTFPKDIRIDLEVPRDLWLVVGDTTQIDQVLLNLCVNARDAMPSGGRLKISAENTVLDENYARLNLEARRGPYVVIDVSDTGTGIPPGTLDKIFEPFFTTKDVGKGTGLGLSTVRAIVRSHGGFVNVYSEVGRGTRFKVFLPAKESETPKADAQIAEAPRGHGQLILVVDDESSVRDITRLTLESYDYRVVTAANGAEGTAQFAQYNREIAVVLLDMMMPIMDGRATIRALEAIDPAVKIIAASGIIDNAIGASANASIGAVVRTVLAKPYTAAQLLKAIHEVVGENRS